MPHEIQVICEGEALVSRSLLLQLQEIRKIKSILSTTTKTPNFPSNGILKQLQALSKILDAADFKREAEALADVYALGILSSDFGGLGYKEDTELDEKQEAAVLFLVAAYLEALNSADRGVAPVPYLTTRPVGRRGMTLSEKIFAAHDIEHKGVVKPGDVVRVNVDWILASELSWRGMETTYDALGKPGIFRNDRFWLAGDHVVDPRIRKMPQVKALVDASERARDQFKLTEYQGMNYTILHTEFCRERAQPGMIAIGSDSHTCSAGSVGTLAIGLGVADVTMPLITGETWFRIPESVNIRFINEPGPGIGGKDTILYILKELKRNTVASDRVVEFTGPGIKHLSSDARFAICNMTTEFGGITGIFVPDEVTYEFINKRKLPRHRANAVYFRPDDDADYVATHTIDLAKVEPFVARYPSPDDVVPVNEMSDTALDGCFIGACTTAEEDLIMGAMVLEAGLRKGLVPVNYGKRKVVPGSLPITHKLRELGLAAIYGKAGFEIGAPGCSYCVGMGADRASEGEVWLSSQNRNFKNRMGKGAIGHISSAATVAASSFSMKITNPRFLLDEIDKDQLAKALGIKSPSIYRTQPRYVEPGAVDLKANPDIKVELSQSGKREVQVPATAPGVNRDIHKGKVQRLEDFIDTDALAPAESLTTCRTNEEFGAYCLKHTHPEFRSRAANGHTIVVAGQAFGCGSSRENAVSALLGCGITCVIAKSFAFIYGRNQPNLGLLGIVIPESETGFWEAAEDGKECEVDVMRCVVKIKGVKREWKFQLSDMERELIAAGGLTSAFRAYGKGLFDVMTSGKREDVGKISGNIAEMKLEENKEEKKLQW
ncbi:aconitase family protein [Xylogone sp. PMI_703]|nr:aconitase family protein [Xylogone sp. PMI_703]